MPVPKVLLVGWDAADWKVIHPLIAAGKMPHVQRLIQNGAAGPIATLHPPLSPMLWTSIATGKRPFRHGILGFSEPTPDGRGVQAVSNLSRKSKALWNILNQNHLRSIVIGWWPSQPAEPIHGVMVSDHYMRASAPLATGWPLLPGAVHPPELAQTLAALRTHPDQLTPELVRPFIPLAHEIDQDQDQRLAACLRTLAEAMSIQSAALWLLDHQPWDFFAVYFEAIDHFCHSFMRYHPPRQSWVAPRDFALYHNVVSAAYQLHDQMLGALLERAGDDTTVILLSDHGFHPDHLRPSAIPDIPAGPAIEHRDYGILAIHGPKIRKASALHGASLLDIAPTILTIYGLPVGEDMDGKVLSTAFVETPAVAFIPSWENVPGDDGRHPPHTRLDPVASHAAMEQLIALGYIEPPHENREIAVRKTIRELRYNLGQSFQDAGRHQEAREIFLDLYRADPAEQRFAVKLFVSCQALGLRDEMRRMVEDLPPSPVSDYLQAQVWIADGRYAGALTALERLAEGHLLRPALFLEIADLQQRLGREQAARDVYEKALTLDPDNAPAHLGLCRLALRRWKYSAAAQSALEALQRVYHDPQAHFLLGRALTGLRDYTRAAEAFRAAISFNPNFPEAQLHLAVLLEKHLHDPASAREHRRLARRMKRSSPVPPAQDAAAAELYPAPQPARVEQPMPPLAESLLVVTGLPRSGTSMLMQMLAAGGLPILSDQSREADEDNPRGYLEYAPVRKLLQDSQWLSEARGKAIKIVAPLLLALPPQLPCRVILCERDLDEVLDSQERMLIRRHEPLAATPERRRLLKAEYARTLARLKAMLNLRPATQLLVIEHRAAISNPLAAAERLSAFLGGPTDPTKMAAAIDPALHRNRTGR